MVLMTDGISVVEILRERKRLERSKARRKAMVEAVKELFGLALMFFILFYGVGGIGR